MANAGVENAALAIAANPGDRHIVIFTIADQAVRLLMHVRLGGIEAEKDVDVGPRVRRRGEAIKFVGPLGLVTVKSRCQRAVGIVEFQSSFLFGSPMTAEPCAKHLAELRPIRGGVGYAVVAGQAASFADKSEQSGAHLGI